MPRVELSKEPRVRRIGRKRLAKQFPIRINEMFEEIYAGYENAVDNLGFSGTLAEWFETGNGPAGPTGPAGADGLGVPAGGTTGQVLAKLSATVRRRRAAIGDRAFFGSVWFGQFELKRCSRAGGCKRVH